MKQVKFLMVALTILMGTMMTSCMNGDDNSKPVGQGIVEVVDYMGMVYFKTFSDIKIYPSSSSLTAIESTMGFKPSSTRMAYIGYDYDPESADNVNAETTNKLIVNLTYAISLDATVENTEKGASNDSISNAPIKGLDKLFTDSGELTVLSNRYLLLGVDYYLTGSKQHYFTVVYYPSEAIADPEELKLYLRHDSKEEATASYQTSSASVGGSYPMLYFKSFDISSILHDFQMRTGKTEMTISLEVDANSSSAKLDDTSTAKKSYTLEYKPKSN